MVLWGDVCSGEVRCVLAGVWYGQLQFGPLGWGKAWSGEVWYGSIKDNVMVYNLDSIGGTILWKAIIVFVSRMIFLRYRLGAVCFSEVC